MQFHQTCAAAALGLCLVIAPASAVTVQLDFTASGFVEAGAPTDPVTGVFTYEAAALGGLPTGGFTSGSMTIGTTTYTPSNLNSGLIGGSLGIFWGSVNGQSISAGTDDVLGFWDPLVLSGPLTLIYATSNTSTTFGTGAGSYTLSEVTAVPEVPLPGALPLFGTGLGVLGLLGWWRKRKQLSAA